MKKRLAALTLGLATLLTLLSAAALADGPAMSGTAGEAVNWEYNFEVTPNTITFSGTGPMDDYDAFGSSQGWNRFSGTAVIIEEGITHVGDRTFGTGPCVSVTIASTVESIGSFAFSNCRSLTAVNIDNPNITIAKNAFQECGNITSFVVAGTEYGTPDEFLSSGGTEVGGGITWKADGSILTFSGTGAIPDYADNAAAVGAAMGEWFFGHAGADLVIEEGITRVGNYAFSGESHPSVTIAASVESIGDFAFNGNEALTMVTIGDPNVRIAETSFYKCGKITSFTVGGKDYGTPRDYYLATYEVPAGTTVIDEYFFQDCTALETFVVPEGVTAIGQNAFDGCTNLKSVTLPSTLKTISSYAFRGCAALESIQLPQDLETLGVNAFEGCGLTAVTIPANVANWGEGSFSGCPDLTQLTLSQGLTSIGSSAFYNCPGLTAVTIPDTVTSIGNYAFRATGLTGVTLPKSVTYLGERPFGIAGLGSDMSWVTDFTITGYSGTEAEAYAKSCGFPFEDLTPAPTPSTPSTPSSSSSSSSSRHSHRWDDGKVTLEPTALTSGLRTYTCKGCGATKTESISAGWAAPVKGETVTITGRPNSKDPTSGLRVVSSTGTDPDPQGGQAYASTQSVEVDGKAVEFQMYALKDEKGNDTNYVKLRDVALTINGTAAQCNVDWQDGYVTVATHTPYTPNGSEMKTPFTGDRSYSAANAVTMIDGEGVLMQAFVLVDDNGGGFTYYKLRDLGQALGFNVGWSAEKGVYLETDRPYDPDN